MTTIDRPTPRASPADAVLAPATPDSSPKPDPDLGEDAGSHQRPVAPGEDWEGHDEIVVGLIADPGLAANLVGHVADELPGALADAVAGHCWRVETAQGPVGLDSEGLLPMLHQGAALRAKHGWDVVVLVTDLPRRADTQPLVSDYGSAQGVGLISLPALGAVRLRRRLRRAVVDLLAHGLLATPADPTTAPGRARRIGHPLRPPVSRIASTQEGIDAHLALHGVRGTARLLGGLVRANRPWRLVPSLSPALAAASAGAAFGVFYSNIWELAMSLPPWRLGGLSVLAVAAMAIWLIVDNKLWERPNDRADPGEAALFNAATAVTVGVGVACMAILLVGLTIIAAVVVIPPHLLAETAGAAAGGPAGYLHLGVLAGAMGIVAGALGSGLTSPEAVRHAAYSTREQQRRALIDDDEPDAHSELAAAGDGESVEVDRHAGPSCG